jgi:ribosomal protein L40E
LANGVRRYKWKSGRFPLHFEKKSIKEDNIMSGKKETKIIKSNDELLKHIEDAGIEGRLTMSPAKLQEVIELTQRAFDAFLEHSGNVQLTPSMRRSLNGVGARRWGFIQETNRAYDANPEFAPGEFEGKLYDELTKQIDQIRQLQALLLQFTFLVGDFAGVLVNAAWNISLIYYRTVQGLAQLHNRVAEGIYSFLRRFFVHRRSTTTAEGEEKEPTKKQLKHDFNALERGTKDGALYIEHHKPHYVGGDEIILDSAHKPTIEYLEAYHNPICPNCHAENHHTNDFCSKCGTKLLIEEEIKK